MIDKRMGATLDRAAWREWGFDLRPEEIARIEGFFKPWFEVYNRPGVDAFDSQESIFAVHRVMEEVVGALPAGRESRGPVSALRAGYCIASVERAMGMRRGVDRALADLFGHMERDEGWPGPEPSLGRAIVVGRRLGDVALEMTIARPEIAVGVPGFELRDALFAELRHTLFAKLVLTTRRRFDRDVGELLMRAGHAVGFAEESLHVRTPRQEGAEPSAPTPAPVLVRPEEVSLAVTPHAASQASGISQAAHGPENPASRLPSAVPPPQAPPAQRRQPPAKRPGPWLRWGRWVTLALCLAAGAAFAWNPATWSDAPTVGIVVGLFATAVTVHLYGLLVWGLMRGLLRRRAWTFQRATYSPLVLILVLLGILGMPALRASRDESSSNPASANPALRSQLEAAGRDQAARQPDPVGQKLAGHSDQVSSSDQEHLNARASLGVHFGSSLTRVLADYNDPKVTGQGWVIATRKRLAQADRAMSGLRRHTAALEDGAMREQLGRFDRVRANALSAFKHLLGVVERGEASGEGAAGDLVNRRLAAYRHEGQRLMDLISPYLTEHERQVLARAGGV